jgi:gliding motility-associated lipoprotein GldH
MLRTYILIFSLFIITFSSCVSSPHYQKEYAVPQNEWKYDFRPSFKFDITDTNARYNLYFLIRHTEAYPNSNIWIWVYTKQPGDSVFQKTRLEIPLSEPNGKWMGRGMGAIWEQRMPISNDGDTVMLRKKGTWEIRFEQNMRVNPLPEVLQVGLRVEKHPLRTFNGQ